MKASNSFLSSAKRPVENMNAIETLILWGFSFTVLYLTLISSKGNGYCFEHDHENSGVNFLPSIIEFMNVYNFTLGIHKV